jgi:hypothetical protein
MHLHISFHFQKPWKRIFHKQHAFYTENEWPNLEEEEEWEENNIREFIKLIKQREQAWKPAKEELETIDVGNEEIKRNTEDRDYDYSEIM